MEYVVIKDNLRIPHSELSFSATRSGGPGGQHVNKVSTSVTLAFDVVGSPSLSDWQRARIMAELATRISREGVLQVTAQDTRSQSANKELAVARFAELMAGALKPRKPRRKTRPTLASRQRRLDAKRSRSALKKSRGRVGHDD